jgi:GNAT superfamily N-acetyltransferase
MHTTVSLRLLPKYLIKATKAASIEITPMQSPHNVKIRAATPTDISSIARIHLESWQIGYRGVVPATTLAQITFEGRMLLWQQRFRNLSRQARVWIAEAGGEAIAFSVTGPPTRGASKPRRDCAEIHSLYVLPIYFGKGVGRYMLNWVLDDLRARKFKEIIVWTIVNNLRARRFYERAGFITDNQTRKTSRLEVQTPIQYEEIHYKLII